MIFQQKISNKLAFIIIMTFGLVIAIVTSMIGSSIVSDISNNNITITSGIEID